MEGRLSAKYISWVDTAKGIGLILVIMGHLWYDSNIPIINRMIYSFHMPMYFVLSGYVINSGKEEKLLDFIKKKAIRLLVPAFSFIILTTPVYIYVYRNDIPSIGKIIADLLFVYGDIPHNGPCWFFIVLFEILVIERFFHLCQKTILIRALSCVLIFSMGYMVYSFATQIVFGFDKALLGLGFLVFGSILKDLKISELKKPYQYIGWFVIFGIWFLFGVVFNDKVSMAYLELGHYWFFIISGITGAIMFFGICKLIDDHIGVFRPHAANTVFIICTHTVIVRAFGKVADIFGIKNTFLYSIFAFLFAVILPWLYIPICNFVNKKLPVLNGKKPIKNKHMSNEELNL